MNLIIRNEQTADIDTITRLTETAFQHEPHSHHTEQFIIQALRRSQQLTISLVALEQDQIVGHIAISPVNISSGATGWYGLGPISVWPEKQLQGIGSTLVKTALAKLQHLGGLGCVLVGDPVFYHHFGFKNHPHLIYPGIPQEYVMALSFGSDVPEGKISFHPAFAATE